MIYNNRFLISLSGTHALGKTYLTKLLSEKYYCNKLINIYRSTIKEIGCNNIKTYRSHEYLLNKFIIKFNKILNEDNSFVSDRFIIDPIVYGYIRNLNKNLDISSIIINLIYNIYKSNKKFILITILFGNIRYLYNLDPDFFNINIFGDKDRKNSVGTGTINNVLDDIEKFESVYLDFISCIKLRYHKIFYLSDFCCSGTKIVDLFNIRNKKIIRYVEECIV